ncbi:Structural maintenance of chromosomes protein 5, partial [Linderina pennispora]
MREQISLLEASHPPEKPQGETEELKRQIAACRERILEMNNEVQQLQDEQRELMRAGGQMNRDLALRDEELRKLDDVVARRRSNLRSFSEDTFKALEWLEANRSKFKQHVFTPICLEASVQNPQYARVIESIVTMSSLRTFVTQCDDDYYTFTQEVIDRMKLRIDVVSYHKSLSDFNPPLPRDTIRELGFDGYAIDFIEAHPTVLAALCNKDNIHEVPVALGRVDNEAIERKGAFKEYVADATKYTITRGRYGAHSSTVMTARIKPQARLLSSGETEEVQAI